MPRRAVSHPVPADAAAHHWSAECDVLDWLRVRGPGYLVDGRKRIPETPVMEAKVDIFSSRQAAPPTSRDETRELASAATRGGGGEERERRRGRDGDPVDVRVPVHEPGSADGASRAFSPNRRRSG